MMLTVGKVSCSGTGIPTETICLGIALIAGTVAETGRRLGGGSVCPLTSG